MFSWVKTVWCGPSDPYSVVVPNSTQYSTSPPALLTTLPRIVAPSCVTEVGLPVCPVAQPDQSSNAITPNAAIALRISRHYRYRSRRANDKRAAPATSAR